MHLFRTPHNPQVIPTVDGSPKVAQSTQQASLWRTLLCATLVRESTSQEIVGDHDWYWCITVLWQERHSSVDLPRAWWRHFSRLFTGEKTRFMDRKKNCFRLGKQCREKGWKRDEKGQKKSFQFFHRMCGSAVNCPHNRTCGPMWHHCKREEGRVLLKDFFFSVKDKLGEGKRRNELSQSGKRTTKSYVKTSPNRDLIESW